MAFAGYVRVGFISKPHGVKGHLRCELESAFEADVKRVGVTFIAQKGGLVPFFVEELTSSGMIRFEDIDTKEAAKDLANQPVYMRETDVRSLNDILDAGDDLPLASFTGFVLVDIEGQDIGVIKEVVQYPEQLMAVVDVNGQDVLVPLNETFIQGVDPEQSAIWVDLPDGLLDIN